MRIFKIIIIYLVIALILEGVIRIYFPEYKSLHHDIGITGGIPFRLNSYGLRDYEFNIDKKDKYRILCLGDSITFGTQNRLEDIYPKVLERLLNSNGSGRYQVINAGGVGGNPYFEYEYLKEKGIKFNPDYVILGISLNDIGSCYALKGKKNDQIKTPNFWIDPKKFRIYKNDLKWSRETPLSSNLKAQLNNTRWFLRSRSYFFSFIETNLLKFMYRKNIKKYSFDLYAEKEQLLSFGIDKSPEEVWEIFFFMLINIRDFLKSKNIGFMIVVFPFEFQMSDDIKDNFYNIDKTKFTIDPQKKLSYFCKKNDITFVDTLPAFRKTNKKIYFPLDYCHPNKYGHSITANEIYCILKRKNI